MTNPDQLGGWTVVDLQKQEWRGDRRVHDRDSAPHGAGIARGADSAPRQNGNDRGACARASDRQRSGGGLWCGRVAFRGVPQSNRERMGGALVEARDYPAGWRSDT